MNTDMHTCAQVSVRQRRREGYRLARGAVACWLSWGALGTVSECFLLSVRFVLTDSIDYIGGTMPFHQLGSRRRSVGQQPGRLQGDSASFVLL